MLKMVELLQNLGIEEEKAWVMHANCKAERKRVLKSISATKSTLLEKMEKLSLKIINEPDADIEKQRCGIQLMEAFIQMESHHLNSMTLDEKSIFRQIKHCFTFDKDGSVLIDQGKKKWLFVACINDDWRLHTKFKASFSSVLLISLLLERSSV